MPLRYGENPHQQAALYLPVGPAARGIAQAEQVQGKELSYNNLNDANAALELVAEFRDGPPTVVIVKHANPCGVATRDTLLDAWNEALACDSVSAFGGIVAINRPLDARDRRSDHARSSPKSSSRPTPTTTRTAIFAKKKNLRLLLTGELPDPARGGQTHGGHRRRHAGPGPRQRHRSRATSSRCVTKRAADRAGTAPTACSPGPSPSTSSRTPSSMPRTASPPASARAR